MNITHTTVGEIVKSVGQAQAEADKILVDELDIIDHLSEGKEVDFLCAGVDGVFVRGIKKRRHHDVYHGITYEGWAKNGERVLLVNPCVMLTTHGVNEFWKEVQTSTIFRYSLENTQIITNKDKDKFILWTDIFESALEELKEIKKQHEIPKKVHKSHYFKQAKHANNSRQGSVSLYTAHSGAVGKLLKSITLSTKKRCVHKVTSVNIAINSLSRKS